MKKNLLSDTDYTSGKDNRYKASVHIGRVAEQNCDGVSTNVRVIMPDKIDHEGQPLITKPVPVLQVASTAKKSFAVPRVGTNVAIMKMPNGTCDYFVLGGFYTTSDPPPVDDPMLDHVTYDDGSVIEFNASNGSLRWDLKGGVSIKTAEPITIETQGDVTIKPAGKAVIEAANIELTGAMKFDGDITHTGDMNTSGNHVDAAGTHQSATREEELRARIEALESQVELLRQRVTGLEARHGN